MHLLDLHKRETGRPLFAKNVIVSQSLVPQVLKSVEGCPGGTLKPSCGLIPLGQVPREVSTHGAEAMSVMLSDTDNLPEPGAAQLEMTKANTRNFDCGPVTMSDTCLQHRCLRPDFRALSLSDTSHEALVPPVAPPEGST